MHFSIRIWSNLVLGLALAAAAQAAPVMNGFDLAGALLPTEQIHAGGPPRDGIPALEQPALVAAAQAHYLQPHSRVLGVVIDGHARAYPLAILNWHEVVNDRLGGVELVVTYCPLCGSGVVYRAEQQGRRLQFGVSGLLYNSDVLLYDRQTDSLWSQLQHRAISGPLKGARLQQLPSRLTSWADWQARYPHTQVLSDATGYGRDYSRNPYGGYEHSLALYFPIEFLSRQYHPKERVLGVELNGVVKAYPFAELAKGGVRGELLDKLNGQVVRLHYDAELRSAELMDADGKLLPSVNSYWFAWFTFHPTTLVYQNPP